VSRQTDANGLRTLTASVSSTKYLLLYNPGPTPLAYSNTIACAYPNAAWFTGWQTQSPRMTPLVVAGGQTVLDTTIPARGQVVFVNSTNVSLFQVGPASGTAFFTQPPPTPVVSDLSLQGSSLFVSGGNGTAGNSFRVLTSTNVSLPIANWTPVATNQFGMGGVFSFTNTVDPAKPAQFYRLKAP
jgi:hypothetical protein